MAKHSKSLLWIFIAFFAVELYLAANLDNVIKIGKNEHGKFSVWIETEHMELAEKITEDFQPDVHLMELREKEGEEKHPLTINWFLWFKSEKLYNLMKKVSPGNPIIEGTPIGTFNLIRMLLIVDLVFLGLALYLRRFFSKSITKPQVMMEMFYLFFEDLVLDTLGKKLKHFTPYVFTLFLFIWVCNLIGLIPIPGFMEPTRNLNVPFGLGVIAVTLVHYMAIKHKGLIPYLKGYAEPLAFLAPINIVGELSKVVSISFRLFGNVLGGAIIMVVVSSLVKMVLLPVGLNLFFGIFVGTIQAFVFTMLALTYIAVEISE